METQLEIKVQNSLLKGVLLKEDSKYLTLKLSSGYNANFKKESIEIVSRKEVDAFTSSSTAKKKTVSSDLPNITILHTGGTIASKVDYETGAVSSQFTADELLNLYPELNEIANFTPEMIANLSSEDMRIEHWNLLLEAVQKAIDDGTQGVIVSHGTDTMHYTSAALEYAFENLPVPVLLVGAQRSSDRASSDAFTNLKTAVEFIVNNSGEKKQFRRVGICMHCDSSDDSFVILDGINAKKMHSSRRGAFKQINYLPAAILENDSQVILRDDLFTLKPEGKFSSSSYNASLKLGFFKAHPQLLPEEIKNLSFYDGVVVEGTGLGHLAVSEFDKLTTINKENLKAVENLVTSTKVVVGVQTVYGQTNMNIYSSGRHLKKTGVYGQYMNLTTESLFVRLAFCLSSKDFDKAWESNLEGFEIKNIDTSFD